MKKIFMLLAGILLFGYQPSFGDDGNNSDEELPINYVTISSNGTEVAQVIVPTENYGECEVLWTTIDGLTCEGQVISYDKFAIATFVKGVWQQNKHENWDSPTTDSGGQNISGTGEGGSTYYNFRYSIGTPTIEFGGGTMQNGIYQGNTIITRKDNNATANCGIYENYFEFDFNDGAWFQISFDGKVLYTSELVVIDKYSDTYGVSVKNFIRTDSIIEFDLIDGEYSETEFAHYEVYLLNSYNEGNNSGNNAEGSHFNYVTISSNGTEVAQVIVPTENYGECEVLWTTIDGLTCEGQVISYDKFAIATFVKGVWQQNKHENWDSPATDSGGQNISGTGEGGSTYYNFRYSIGTPTTEFGGGTMQNGIYQGNTIITRKDNNATANCGIYENYFEFDFNDGAWFQISFDGKVLYTSELVVIDKYSDTYGVSVKNFIRTDSIIEFDLIDGEYSETKFAHYVIDNKSFTTDEKGSAANSVSIYAHGNTIIIENATEEIRVYDAMGRLICRDATPCVRNEKNVNVTGVYIVKVGNVAKRVVIN